jgi:hypothetical protein
MAMQSGYEPWPSRSNVSKPSAREISVVRVTARPFGSLEKDVLCVLNGGGGG